MFDARSGPLLRGRSDLSESQERRCSRTAEPRDGLRRYGTATLNRFLRTPCARYYTPPMHEGTDVLVVGAGPVGLLMAAELRRHDVTCRIIDKLVEPMSWVKALGVSQRTLEVWDDLGIVTEALDAGLTLRRQRIFINRQQMLDADVAFPDEAPYKYPLLLPQPETDASSACTSPGSGCGWSAASNCVRWNKTTRACGRCLPNPAVRRSCAAATWSAATEPTARSAINSNYPSRAGNFPPASCWRTSPSTGSSPTPPPASSWRCATTPWRTSWSASPIGTAPTRVSPVTASRPWHSPCRRPTGTVPRRRSPRRR